MSIDINTATKTQLESFHIVIQTLHMQTEATESRIQEQVENLSVRIESIDGMITMFENHQSILIDVIDKQALKLNAIMDAMNASRMRTRGGTALHIVP